MSDIIQLLPDSVANQIAAGEVVQRPASVVKELVENAIDAGATSIQIIVKDAGRTLIQVIDNGKGMSPSDARLAFERHATSKIRKANDLFDLHTMGFRGEALASIAAISQIELRTRLCDGDVGTLIQLSASNVELQECISCPTGSNISVKNLFYNVPARRKFLKNNQTELGYILGEIERIALVNTEVEFVVTHNDNELYNLPVSAFKQRIITLFGKTFNQQLLKVEANTTLIKIGGYVGKPEAARKRNALQYLFVNNRYMRHPYFHKAIMLCYEQLIPAGEMPNYFLHFTVDPASIDVNIHPTKTEIKFENEQPIWQIITAAVKEALGKFSAVPSIDFDMVDAPEIPIYNSGNHNEPVHVPTTSYTPGYNPFKVSEKRPVQGWDKLYEGFNSSREMPDVAADEGQQLFESKVNRTNTSMTMESIPMSTSEVQTPQTETKQPSETVSLDSIMNVRTHNYHLPFKGRYILTAVKSGLMMIDQHRAHVRILFDRYLSYIEQKRGVSQRLLFPEMIQLSAAQSATLSTITEDIAFLGFDLADMGNGAFAINAVPAEIEGVDVVQLLHQMVEEASATGGDVKRAIQERIALSLARAAAIPYGQLLSQTEMEQLIDNLFACTLPNYTPSGKPTLWMMSDDELEKRFK